MSKFCTMKFEEKLASYYDSFRPQSKCNYKMENVRCEADVVIMFRLLLLDLNGMKFCDRNGFPINWTQ